MLLSTCNCKKRSICSSNRYSFPQANTGLITNTLHLSSTLETWSCKQRCLLSCGWLEDDPNVNVGGERGPPPLLIRTQSHGRGRWIPPPPTCLHLYYMVRFMVERWDLHKHTTQLQSINQTHLRTTLHNTRKHKNLIFSQM